jgi:hypothetical protein
MHLYYIFFPNQEKILEQPSLATLDATQLKEPAIFYQASTCDHEVDTTSQDNLDFGAEINKSDKNFISMYTAEI